MYKRFFKIIFDYLVALMIAPIVILIAIILKPLVFFDDHGPLFYISKRAGKNGKIFNMLKFRSMKVNSPNLLNSDGSTYNAPNDERMTKIGKLLRQLSIDELPQVFNILKGEMSWIGPRPVLDTQVLTFTEEERGKLKVLPGISGYTQAYNRNQLSSHDERMMDAWYADHVSFILDMKIILKTLQTIVHPSSVYRNK